MRRFGILALIAPTVIAASVAAAPSFALQAGNSAYPTADSPLSAEITSKLDTKNATVGEVVTAKTLAEASLANGTAIPRGAVLNGKVTAVQSKSSGGGTASVTISFDQVTPSKKASPLAIHGVLAGVAPKPSLSDAGPDAANLPTGSTKSQVMTAGETGQGIDNSASAGETVATGSSLKNVALAAGTLTSSHGDIKLDHGARIAVALQAN
ncbi:MAG: hypothetical protein WCE63_02990 [Acidobacteriaceae bacterium]